MVARIMHKFSTAATKSSGMLHRPRCTTRKRVPPRVAERRQIVHFSRFVTRTYAQSGPGHVIAPKGASWKN